MIKKIAILFILTTLVSCTAVKEKASGIKEMGNIGLAASELIPHIRNALN